jgi:hypothetical protein
MATITVWNKGKRSWDVKNAEGKPAKLNPQESLEMDEAEGRRLCMNYPKDLSTSGIVGPSSSDLARQEQSLRDRTANLDKREAAIKAREDAMNELPADPISDKPKRGRPAKTSPEGNAEEPGSEAPPIKAE